MEISDKQSGLCFGLIGYSRFFFFKTDGFCLLFRELKRNLLRSSPINDPACMEYFTGASLQSKKSGWSASG
jgi:hypothetical protein